MSLTGDPLTDALVPAALSLAWDVKLRDRDQITETLAGVVDEFGTLGLRALCVVLAAMIRDDRSAEHMLTWLQDPEEYLRLRENGVETDTALTVLYSKSLRNAA